MGWEIEFFRQGVDETVRDIKYYFAIQGLLIGLSEEKHIQLERNLTALLESFQEEIRQDVKESAVVAMRVMLAEERARLLQPSEN